jgi:hypothetical protein
MRAGPRGTSRLQLRLLSFLASQIVSEYTDQGLFRLVNVVLFNMLSITRVCNVLGKSVAHPPVIIRNAPRPEENYNNLKRTMSQSKFIK